MKCVIVVPARMASTRFPGKPLVDLLGKPMIQWVVEVARASGVGEEVIVATPDQEIIDACASFGARAEITRADHPSGTDRIAELAERVQAEIYVNVQGDEPLIAPETIQACVAPLLANSTVLMGSVWAACTPEDEPNPAVVKVVTDLAGNALYFSRHAIPFPRSPRMVPLKKHVGIYAYRREVLAEFSRWAPTPLEQTESLEQLRFLENGIKIRMSEGLQSPIGVDTPEQAEEARIRLAGRG